MFHTIILSEHCGHLFRIASLCLCFIVTIRSYLSSCLPSKPSGVFFRYWFAFSLAKYFFASSETGIAGSVPADSTFVSGLSFLNSASATGLRYAFPEHTNNTFKLATSSLMRAISAHAVTYILDLLVEFSPDTCLLFLQVSFPAVPF